MGVGPLRLHRAEREARARALSPAIAPAAIAAPVAPAVATTDADLDRLTTPDPAARKKWSTKRGAGKK